MDIKKLFGKRLSLAQELRGLTRENLAEMLGVHPTYISKLQRGDVNVGIETAQKVSEVLKFPISFFLEENYSINLREAETLSKKARTERQGRKQAAH